MKNYLQRFSEYYRAEAEDINRHNWSLLRIMSPAYLISLVGYYLLVCLPHPVERQNVVVLIAFIVQLVYTTAIWPLRKPPSPSVTQNLILLFGLFIMALSTALGTWVFSNSSALLFPLMLVMMSQIYTLPPHRVFILISSCAILFLALSLSMKPISLFYQDLVATCVASAVSLTSYWAILHYQADAYVVRRELDRICTIDQMTGVLCKTAFQQEFCRFLDSREAGQTFGLAIMDMDHFKTINDRYGHLAGDRALCAFSAMLAEEFGADRTEIGRFGGDEFAVLFRDAADEDGIRSAIKKLLCRARQELPEKLGLSMTCSAGLVITAASEVSFEEAFTLADAALYVAKQEGGNTCLLADASALSEKETIV